MQCSQQTDIERDMQTRGMQLAQPHRTQELRCCPCPPWSPHTSAASHLSPHARLTSGLISHSSPHTTALRFVDYSGRVGLAVGRLNAMARMGGGGTNHLPPAQLVTPISHPFERGGGHWRLFFAHAALMLMGYHPQISARGGVVCSAQTSRQQTL